MKAIIWKGNLDKTPEGMCKNCIFDKICTAESDEFMNTLSEALEGEGDCENGNFQLVDIPTKEE